MAKKTKKSTKNAAKAAARKTAAKKTVKKAAPRNAQAKKVVAKKAARAASKPRGSALVSVSAGLTANDAVASIKWYSEVLGFKVLERWEHEGRFIGAQIGSGGVTFNVSQDDWKQGRDRVKGQGTRIFITMGPDVDGYARSITSRGGVLASEPVSEWGMRAFSINDPDGFKLTFMSELPK